MTQVTATFYDGKTSHRHEVRLHFDRTGRLRITGLKHDLTYPLSEVRITSRLGNTPRSIYLPGDAKCETLENDAIDAILQRWGRGRWQAVLHTLESKLGYVLLALVLTIVSVWGLLNYGIPALAKHAAYALPPSVDAALGREGLKVLDQALFTPSRLEDTRQSQLRARFSDMAQEVSEAPHLRLEFRKSDRVGPNALALPSGIIVMTDELVLLAEHDDELTAILAHEIGHVTQRHALRSLLQNSVAVLIISSLTGDVTSVTALSAALPTLLLEAKYSRTFETEADQFALQYLRDHDVPPKHFADILVRMEEASGADSSTHNYLATHPASSDRVRIFQAER